MSGCDLNAPANRNQPISAQARIEEAPVADVVMIDNQQAMNHERSMPVARLVRRQ